MEAVFHSYVDGKPMHELSRVCDQMEADFIGEHSAMIDRIAAERERQGLTPLQEVSHLNENFDNARDDGKKDHADVEVVDAAEIDGLDVTALRKTLGKDGFFIRDNGSVALYLFQEDKGVVALVDEWENVTYMRLTLDGYHWDNETKDVFKKQIRNPTGLSKNRKLLAVLYGRELFCCLAHKGDRAHRGRSVSYNMYPNPFWRSLGAFSAVFRLHIHDYGLHSDAQKKTPKMTNLCYPQEK